MTDQVQPACDTDQMEADVTAVIEACGGNRRTAIKALLIEQQIQEQRIERLASALSFGYVRGRIGIASGQSGSRHGETARPRCVRQRSAEAYTQPVEASIPCDSVIRDGHSVP